MDDVHVWAYGIELMPMHITQNQWGAGRRWMVLIFELTPFLVYRKGHLQRVMCTVLEADVLLCFAFLCSARPVISELSPGRHFTFYFSPARQLYVWIVTHFSV